jgi:hypothetical protein
VTKKSVLVAFALAGVWFLPGANTPCQAAPPQQSSTSTQQSSQGVSDQDITLMREDIRSQKKQLVAANLMLTDAEATKFWPLYDQYTAELVKINNEKYEVIKEYANNWGSITDPQAISLAKRYMDVDLNVAQLRLKYLPIFQTVLPGKKVATFFQIERRLQMMIELQLSSQIPLVQAQPSH